LGKKRDTIKDWGFLVLIIVIFSLPFIYYFFLILGVFGNWVPMHVFAVIVVTMGIIMVISAPIVHVQTKNIKKRIDALLLKKIEDAMREDPDLEDVEDTFNDLNNEEKKEFAKGFRKHLFNEFASGDLPRDD